MSARNCCDNTFVSLLVDRDMSLVDSDMSLVDSDMSSLDIEDRHELVVKSRGDCNVKRSCRSSDEGTRSHNMLTDCSSMRNASSSAVHMSR